MTPQELPSTTARPFAALCALASLLALLALAGCGGGEDPPDREQLVPKGMRRTTVTAQDAGHHVTTATETTAPVAALPEAGSPEVAVTLEPPAVEPAAETAPDVEPASVAPSPAEDAPAATPGTWTVQAGAFTRAETAAGVVDKLRGAGIAAAVETADVGGTTYRRVVVNGLADRAAAEALAARLKAEFALNALVREAHAAGR